MRLLVLSAFIALCGCAPRAQPTPPASDETWTAAALADLRALATSASAEGLPDEQVALSELRRFESAAPTAPAARIQLGVAANALFDSLARSFAQGALSPSAVDPTWMIEPPAAPDVLALRRAVQAGELPSTVLRPLLPSSDEYVALRAELERVRREPPGTADEYGRSREARINALRSNMERWRWLPRVLEEKRVEVRVAQAESTLYLLNRRASMHLAIVGAQRSPTPTFRANMTSITLNPSWTPPSEILRNELLPRFRRDPSAAAAQGFDVIDHNGAVIDPGQVNWSAQPFPYMLRQRPGAANALGRIRFDLPNRFAVYLHDTPNRALFAREQRAFSHGCIRVEDPIGLAEAVLSDPRWTRSEIEAAIESNEPRRINVNPATPVYILYLTAWVNEEETVVYGNDVYGRDAYVLAGLDAPDVALVAAAAASVTCPG